MTAQLFRTKVVRVILALILVESLSFRGQGQASSPELPPPGLVIGITREQQTQLGLQTAAAVYKQVPVLPDSNPVTQYVQQLGRRLVPVIPPEQSWPYEFHVIPQKEINAFALPGGPIFVNVGTIQAADSEAELAGVMAHEMSHVYMQHSVKQATKQSLAQGVLGILSGVLPENTLGNVARLGFKVGAQTIFLKYSREDEAQADAVGAVIMYKAGYNPQAMADFFQKLEQQGGGNGPQFLSDHPNPGNRNVAIEKEISGWSPKKYAGTSAAFTKARQKALRMKTYSAQQIADGAKQGLWAAQNQRNGAVLRNMPAATKQQ